MITNEQIREAINDASKKGYIITTKDFAYALLCHNVEDYNIAYRCIFGSDKGFMQEHAASYDKQGAIEYLKNYVDIMLIDKKKKTVEDISFEENKAYMLKLKKDTEAAMEEGTIETKDALKILADISVKLNDRFQVKDETKEQIVIVNAKYNDICPKCQTEISRRPISKEEAMEMYDLIEKNTEE